jgi:hypothetical protein
MSIAIGAGKSKVIHNAAVGKTSSHTVAHDQEAQDTLASRLALAMKLKGVNANQIETATGIPRQAIYAARDGKSLKLMGDTLVKLCEYLGVRPKWLADGELPMHATPSLDQDEVQLIENYRHMSPANQKALRDIAERWSEEDDPKPGKHRPFPRPPKH